MQVKSDRNERESDFSRKQREGKEIRDLPYYLKRVKPRHQVASLPSGCLRNVARKGVGRLKPIDWV